MTGQRPRARAEDPRERDDGLGWAARAVFPDHRVWLRLSRSRRPQPPPGVEPVARFLPAPHPDRARFLLPLAARRVTAGSVLAYNALRPPRVRLARAVIGGLAKLGAAGLVPVARSPVLHVGVPVGADRRELLLVEHLAGVLGAEELYAAIGVPVPDPNYKPTLQLFDVHGSPRGYAKVGWNPATRALVRTEVRTLTTLGRVDPDQFPFVPHLLAGGDWAGSELALIAPLPPRVRRMPVTTAPRAAEMLAVARRGRPAPPALRFGGSPYAANLLRRAGLAASIGPDPAAGRFLRDLVDRLCDRDRDTILEFGAWHGDWVPWNLGLLGATGQLAVWDWEHSGESAPVGLDLAHQGFQSALVLRGESALAATGAAAGTLAQHGNRLGLDSHRQRLVLDAYLLELWLRAWRLARDGAGWNQALHPDLLTVLAHRLPAGADIAINGGGQPGPGRGITGEGGAG